MKKVMFALAIAGMFSFAACGSNAEAEAVDSNAVCEEQVENVAEEATDSIAAVEEVAEEAATEADAQ